MSRDAWLTMHIIGVVLFLGNIIVTAVWKMLAYRTREAAVVAFGQRLVVVHPVSGQVMAEDFGGVMRSES